LEIMRDTPAGGLTWQEGAGLTIAAVAHIALLVAFSLAPPGKKIQPAPQPIEITFSDEISDQSTSPDPAAQAAPDVAPDQGEAQPEPEPEAEPVRQPQPAPLQPARPQPDPPKPQAVSPRTTAVKPVVKPQPAPARAVPAKPVANPSPAKPPVAKPVSKPANPAPVRRPETPSGASRIGSDFLKGIPAASTPGTAKTPPAALAGPDVRSSLASSMARQIKAHWAGPQGVDVDKLVTVLAWELNPDGSLAARPRLVSQTGITPANEAQAKRHIELAIRAVQLAAPFDLPAEYYGNWKRVAAFRFDKRLSQ
jgi:outer membrane biosynthesis protein TonB